MATEKGWFIKSKSPNDIFWSLRKEVEAGWTTDIHLALMFARQVDAETYFENHFHPTAREQYLVAGVH